MTRNPSIRRSRKSSEIELSNLNTILKRLKQQQMTQAVVVVILINTKTLRKNTSSLKTSIKSVASRFTN